MPPKVNGSKNLFLKKLSSERGGRWDSDGRGKTVTERDNSFDCPWIAIETLTTQVKLLTLQKKFRICFMIEKKGRHYKINWWLTWVMCF